MVLGAGEIAEAMKPMRIVFTMVAALAVIPTAVAVPVGITFDVLQNPANGANFSFLHEATTAHMEFETFDFWGGGAANRIGNAAGTDTLSGTYDAALGTVTGLGGTLNIDHSLHPSLRVFEFTA